MNIFFVIPAQAGISPLGIVARRVETPACAGAAAWGDRRA
jgi:hypothetical protein